MWKIVTVLLCSLALAGCGTDRPSASPTFTIAAAPQALTLVGGGTGQQLTVTASGQNGFTGPVQVSLTTLPAGVVATPSTVQVTPGQLAQITLTASSSATTGTGSVTVQGSAATQTNTVAVDVVVSAPAPVITTATLSASSFSFGNDLLGTTLTKPVVKVQNTGSAPLTLSPKVSGDASFSVAPTSGCKATLAPTASCTVSMSYAPTVASGSTAQSAVLDLGFSDVPSGTPHTVKVSGVAAAQPQGTVTATKNPQVAQYSMTLPFPGAMTVSFGKDTTYGLKTWSQKTTGAGQTVNMYVAGMLGQSTYHMQAAVAYANGLTSTDVDHTFMTGTPLVQPQLIVTTTPGLTPQPGVEQLTGLSGPGLGLSVTDLQGGVLWSYYLADAVPSYGVQGAKQLANGNFLLSFGNNSSVALGGPPAAGVNVAIREIDLAGNIVREISLLDLNAELTTAGYNFSLLTFHHDVTPLPNGHWLVLGNTSRAFTDLPGYPGTTNVLGDVIVDLDTNLQPVWVWNEFDHFDVNRHPFNFPDWTHTNAIVYSKDDGDLLVSVRHQNWVVKVDYQDGKGTGGVVWRLGQGGDFTLVGGVDPTDWQYAQHLPSFVSANTSGVFSLVLMDNGDDRAFPAGVTCGAAGASACHYSTVPIFQIDETAKTAKLLFHQILPTNLYSAYAGNAEVLANGNVEYDLAGLPGGSSVFEVTQSATPETVWELQSTGTALYRAYRIPSLYPGVQW